MQYQYDYWQNIFILVLGYFPTKTVDHGRQFQSIAISLNISNKFTLQSFDGNVTSGYILRWYAVKHYEYFNEDILYYSFTHYLFTQKT